MIRSIWTTLFLLLLLTLTIPAFAQVPTAQPRYLSITGGQNMELVPAGKLVDTFNSPTTLDTTNNWSTPTTSGTGATATYTQGQEILNSGTATGAYALLTSQAQFQIKSPAYLIYRGAINAQGSGGEVLNTCKEMGLFIAAATPTCAAPVTDGVLFEITTTGKLQAVTYASGARTLIQDLSVTVPGVTYAPVFNPDGVTLVCPGRSTPQAADTCPHILDIWFNGNSAEFDVDFKPVATMQNGSLGPNNNLLQWSALTINAGSTVGTTLKINQAVVGDEARTNINTCDPTYGWRCLNITSGGTPLPSIPATSITASATGSTGAVTATLASAAGKTTYLCSVQIGEAGTGTATATASNTITGTLNYVVTAPGNFTITYTPCVPANAAATTIPVATASNGSATAVAVTATGYQQ